MKRPHPFTLAFAVILVALFVWIQSMPRTGYVIYWQSGITKSHVGYGWPFCFFFIAKTPPIVQFPPLLLNVAIAFALLSVPICVCHYLVRRTLHIHLRTAVLLMLAAALLLFLNMRPQEDPSWIPPTLYHGWPAWCVIQNEDGYYDVLRPGIAINTLVALTTLSLVLLLSESLLTRRKPAGGD